MPSRRPALQIALPEYLIVNAWRKLSHITKHENHGNDKRKIHLK